MPTYEVRLEATDSPQYRRVTVEAADEQAAREGALVLETRRAAYTLLPPDEATWQTPPGTDPDDPDGLVDMRRWDYNSGEWGKWLATQDYSTVQKEADARLRRFQERATFRDGKIVDKSLSTNQAVRLATHLQAEPYEIVDTRLVTPDEIAAGQEALEGAIRMRDIARQYQANPPHGIDPATWVKVEELLRQGGVPMAVVTAVLLGPAWLVQITGTSGSSVFSSATLKIMLMTSYTLDQDAHDFANDFATEISGTGYTTGGYTFAAKAQSYDTGTDTVRMDNTTDPSWTTSTLSATDAGIYVAKGGASSADPALAAIDFGATVTTTAGTFQITLDATGWAVFDLT